MLQNVAEWLQRIVALLILAGFLELILPQNELKNVSKMIMGLLIIVVLIQPLTQLMHIPSEIVWSLANPGSETISGPPTAQILDRGLSLQKRWTTQLDEQNHRLFEDKIRNILGLIDDIQLLETKIDFTGGAPRQILVKVKPVEPRLDVKSFRKTAARKIKNALELISNLNEDQIEVTWDGRSQTE